MTLSEFSYYVRRFGPFVAGGFVLIIIFYLLISALISAIVNRPVETVYQPPFGQLDPIVFSHKVEYPPSFTMVMENLEGRPVTTTSSAQIYYIPSYRTRFGYQQTVSYMARAVGIDTEVVPYRVEGLTATFKDDLRKLDVDISTYNFTFETDFTKIPDVFSQAVIPSENVIREEAKSFMRQMNKYTEVFARGKEKVIYVKYDAATNDFTVVDDPTQANLVEVDFSPPDLNGYPYVSPKFFNSQNFVTIVFRPEGNLVVKAQVQHFEPDQSTLGSYPLKTGDQAFQELLDRKGIIVATSPGSTDIIIREMFLGYYAPELYQQYLMPVYVFLGDNGFAAYVSAVDDTYVATQSASAPPSEQE